MNWPIPALVISLALGACASGDQETHTLESWPNTNFYAQEFCWDLARLDESTPGYQDLADWCLKREMRDDAFQS